MDEKTAAGRIERLRQLIRHHNRRYYVDNHPEISDREFDVLMRELEDLERRFPSQDDPNSPSRRVGGEPLGGFASVVHRVPMLSLQNTYSELEVREFDARVRRILGRDEAIDYIAELKIDGVAVALRYRNGVFALGVTRGDAVRGDDITANLRTVRNLPLLLDPVDRALPAEFEVRGEVFFPRAAFDALNAARTEAGRRAFANPRNAAAGTLKLLDPRQVASRPLRLTVYQLVAARELGLDTHLQVLQLLRALGLPVSPHARLARDVEEALRVFQEWEHKRFQLDYETDGMVLKVNRLDWQGDLGATSKAPRWGIAYKFETQQAITRVRAITVQVGRTGSMTPVAELEPVELAGTTVKRATLHNADEIARQDVRIGDLVSIEKGGEIIPKVTGVLKDRRSGREQAFRFPTRCPVCAEPLEREEGHVAIRCLNEHCPAQLKRRILHFAARGALDIAGLGAALVDQLVDREIVEDVADLFSLQQSQIAGLERMGEKSVQNILAAIEESKRRDLARLIFALGIRHVGTHAARLLAQSYSSIRQLARADPEELAAIEEIGPVIADSVHRYLRRKETRALLRKLAQAGVSLAEEERPPPAGTLGGLTFVLTGTLVEVTRREAQRLIESQGGRVASSVSSRTNYLLAGTDPGSKLRKAQQLGVTVLDLPGLQRLIAVPRRKA